MKKKTLQRLIMMVVAANYCSSMASFGAAKPEERRAPAGGGKQAAAQRQAEARSSQEQAVRGREEQARAAQQESIRQQRQVHQAPAREERPQQQVREQQREQGAAQEHRQQGSFNAHEQQQQASFSAQEHEQQAKFNAQQHELSHPQQFATMGSENSNVLQHQFEAHPITGRTVPLEKATSMPYIQPNATQAEVSHFNQVEANLRQHLIAMPINQMPSNFNQIQEQTLSNYANNYQFMLNNQMLRINRENTFFSPVPSYEYPAWWQPSPGWVFSNGFSLGNSLNVGLDWLRWGWHPYYGPPPQGFVCAANYMPTPWIYVPAYGLWRLAGSNAWAPGGPPFNYSGPITVEVLEPRRMRIEDPYTRMVSNSTINVPYFYNAFFNPQNDRWLYTNRHGYPVYVNL